MEGTVSGLSRLQCFLFSLGKMCSVRELMRDDSAGARKGEESGWDKAEMGQGGDTATVVTAGSGTGGGAGALDQEVLSNHTNGSIKSRGSECSYTYALLQHSEGGFFS